MTAAHQIPAFQKIVLSLGGLAFACGLFMASAPAAHAAPLTEEQKDAVVNLLVAFDTDEAVISQVKGILTVAEVPSGTAVVYDTGHAALPVVLGAEDGPGIAVAPTCGVGETRSSGSGSCATTTTAVAMAPVAPRAPQAPQAPMPLMTAAMANVVAPDFAGLLVAAAAAPYEALVEIFEDMFVSLGLN